MVVEKFGDTSGDNGRAMISDDYPDFDSSSTGAEEDTQDTPTFNLYNITDDPDEQSPLDLDTLDSTQQTAYDHLLAKEAAIGGGYSDPAGPAGRRNLLLHHPGQQREYRPRPHCSPRPDAGNA